MLRLLLILLLIPAFSYADVGTITVTKTGATTVKLITPGVQGVPGMAGADANEPFTDVRKFGAEGDGVIFMDGVIAAGSAVFTGNSETFKPTDVGKLFMIYGAGVSGGLLTSTIAGYTSPHVITLADMAITTVTSGGRGAYGSNNSSSISAAISNAGALVTNNGGGTSLSGGATILFPSGIFLTDTQTLITKSNIRFKGSGASTTIMYAGNTSIDGAVKFGQVGVIDTSCSGANSCLMMAGASDITFRGNSNSAVALLLSSVHHSTFNNLRLRDATRSAIETQFMVDSHFYNIDARTVLTEDSFVIPDNGVYLTAPISNRYATTGNTDWHGTVAGHSGICGIKIDYGFANAFFGGSAIASPTGICIVGNMAYGAISNTFQGFDMEANTTDINTSGTANVFIGMQATSGINVHNSTNEMFLGGNYVKDFVIDSSAAKTFLNNIRKGAGFADNSTTTTIIDGDGVGVTIPNSGSVLSKTTSGVAYNMIGSFADNNLYIGSTSQVGKTIIRSGNGNLDYIGSVINATSLANLNLPNNVAINSKTTGGTVIPVVNFYTDNNLYIGSSVQVGSTVIRSGSGVITFPSKTGTGQSFACFDPSGNLVRSDTVCR
jgi:hypothetical protein